MIRNIFSNPYKVGEEIIICQPIQYCEEYCILCDKITPFLNGICCINCNSFSPFGDFNDYSISINDWNTYFLNNMKTLK
jgi:hypothetical protein